MGKAIRQDGIPAGNYSNKYHSRNPLVNYLMNTFKKSIYSLLSNRKNEIKSCTECGCGEGEITRYVYELLDEVPTRAFDFSSEIISLAKENHKDTLIEFEQKSIYDLDSSYRADLVICCEVLEHLEKPHLALQKMKALNANYYLLSVPSEPVWRILNFCRGKYINNLGNTPGHIQHWSTKQFEKLIRENGFEIIDVNNPFPWSCLLAINTP